MGTTMHFVAMHPAQDALVAAEARIRGLEAAWSRFREDSDVAALNRAAGSWVDVSADTMKLVLAAIEASRATGGACDATVLAAVRAAGYDRSAHEPGLRREVRSPGPAPGCEAIELDERRGRVRLPPGCGFDPGGIGKGLAVDMVAESFDAAGFCLNAGGDVRVGGDPPEGDDGWWVEIDHEPSRRYVCVVDGAVATSSTRRRRWRTQHGERHHLIDPRTGGAPASDVAAATAIAATAATAETWAKTAIVRPWHAAPPDVHLMVTRIDGSVVITPDERMFVA